jgi:hypothetical protein
MRLPFIDSDLLYIEVPFIDSDLLYIEVPIKASLTVFQLNNYICNETIVYFANYGEAKQTLY